MVGKPLHHAYSSSSDLPDELSVLHHKARGSPEGSGGGGWCQRWKRRLLGPHGPRCVVCLQVQHVTGMPPATEGCSLVVGWMRKGNGVEHTVPAQVSRDGTAEFDEVFLRYFQASLRSFTLWAMLAGGGGDLGAFPVDIHTLTGKIHGGDELVFPLGGAGAGAVLTVSVYCRPMGQEQIHGANANGHARERNTKVKRSSGLLNMSCLRSQPAPPLASSGSAWPVTALTLDSVGFITIENSVAEMEEQDDDEGAGFITLEHDTISFGSRMASETIAGMSEEDEKSCLFMEPLGDQAAEKVEDEFLAMLEDNVPSVSLESLVKDAEMDMARAWKSKVSASIIEEEEYKDLVTRWISKGLITPSSNYAG